MASGDAQEAYDAYGHVKKLNANTTVEELFKLYSAWGAKYDEDVMDLAYIGPAVAADQLTRKLKEFGHKNDVSILDLGCGTGLVGEELYKCGYKNIDGVDLCAKFMKVAEAKGIYRSLRQGVMGSEQCQDLGVVAKQYDAVICVGVFTTGHVKAKGFDDLVHVLKPGGLASFGVHEKTLNDPDYGFDVKMNQLSDEGKWKLICKYYEPHYYRDGNAWFYIYQVL